MSVPALAAALPDGAAADLLAIVRISEEIKRIDAVADTVNLMAHNAIFLSRRAGAEALGFGVLSNELRGFSEELHARMHALRTLAHDAVSRISALVRTDRIDIILAAAGRAREIPALNAVLARRRSERETRAGALRAMRRALRLAVDDVVRLVELGGVLAKSARIEAAYGNAHARALTAVALRFAGVLERIGESLARLRKSRFLNDARRVPAAGGARPRPHLPPGAGVAPVPAGAGACS